MQRLESLLKHFLLPPPIPKSKHDIHSTQWETFIQSIHTKIASRLQIPRTMLTKQAL